MATKVELPPRSLEEVVTAFPRLRQSLLSKMDDCALSTLFELEGSPYTNAAQARGIIGHRAAAKILKQLQSSGETGMETEEAMQILYEACEQLDVPDEEVVIVPMRERRMLRIAILRLVHEHGRPREFGMHGLIDVERRLDATLTYHHPNGGFVERVITGQPDALLVDMEHPDDGAVVLDWKFSWGVPPAGKPDDHSDDPAHVSYQGYFQQRFYGLLVMRNYPKVKRVRLREFYPLKSVARYGTILEEHLEHIERELAGICQLLDRGLVGGAESAIWQPSPGKHCGYCAAPQRCPIKAHTRVTEKGVTSWAEAEAAVAQLYLARQVNDKLWKAASAWYEAHGPVPVKTSKGRMEFRWKPNATGNGGRYGFFVPDTSDRGPHDPKLDEIFAQVAERARASTGMNHG